MADTFLRIPTVLQRTGLSRSSLYERIKAQEFPAPISLGGRAVAWLDSEVNDWMAKRIETSRKSGQG